MIVLIRNACQRLRDRLRRRPQLAEGLKITGWERGPFAVVVTDPAWPDDPSFPIVVSPPTGYTSKAAAVRYAMRFVGRTGASYRYAVAHCKTEAQFRLFYGREG